MKILVSAFEPFNENNVNFSNIVLNELAEHKAVVKVTLQVEYIASFTMLKAAIIEHSPTIIILLGEARSYASVGFEVIGVNEYGKQADNINNVPAKRFISEEGPDGIFTTLDYDKFAAAFCETKTAFHRSYSAGVYVCNALLYNTLVYLKDHNLNVLCGFIHIPDFAKQDRLSIVSGLNNYIAKLIN